MVQFGLLWLNHRAYMSGGKVISSNESSSLKDRLLHAGCSPDDADGWEREMQQWQEHSVRHFFFLKERTDSVVQQISAFLEKLSQLNAKSSSPVRSAPIPPALEDPKLDSKAFSLFPFLFVFNNVLCLAVYVNPETGEIGGPKGPEPTRYNDWSYKGRVTDF